MFVLEQGQGNKESSKRECSDEESDDVSESKRRKSED